MTARFTKTARQLLLAGSYGAMLAHGSMALATDIATEPLITSGSSGVKPNLFFVLDNSGSMLWDYLPDWVVDGQYCKGMGTGTSNYCCRNASGTYINSDDTNDTCLPQNSSGTNLDTTSRSNLRGMLPFYSSKFNSQYYDPEIYYQPPQDANGNPKTSYSGAGSVPWDGYNVQYTASINLTSEFPDVEWCTDSSYTDCLRDDSYVLPGTVDGKVYVVMREVRATGTSKFATGTPQAPTSTVSRSVGPFYYVMLPREYCTNAKQTDCAVATGPTDARPFPATLRWCNSDALSNCKLIRSGAYQYPRYPTIITGITAGASATATFTVSGVGDSNCTNSGSSRCGAGSIGTVCVGRTNTVTVSSIKVGGATEILTAPFVFCNTDNTQSTRNRELAEAIRSRIGFGFSATRSSASVTVSTPLTDNFNGQALGYTVSGGGATLSAASFNNSGVDISGIVSVPGSFKRIDIVSGQTYGNIVDSNGNTIVDRSRRTDCAAAPNCTYAEELRNFANWFAWYRSRMQVMKSAVGLAFQSVDDHFRVGYFTLNDASSNLVNIGDFNSTQRGDWYEELYAADPSGSTPLRQALAKAGRIYGGYTTAISGATDPVQYSCQKNFTILSSDGYWNDGSSGLTLDGSATIGNVDGTDSDLPRPQLDGLDRSGTLADVAAYYYSTDLRDSCAVGDGRCTNDVPPGSRDTNRKQHMVTYTIGLGQNGVMQYRRRYLQDPGSTDLPDDFSAVVAGSTPNIAGGVCSWQSSGSECNWPQPGANLQQNIDDMWHAAVNGHGLYYTASNPKDVAGGVRDILREVDVSTGAAAAATTSNPNVTAADKFVFSSSYRSGEWSGELEMQEIDTSNGTIVPGSLWGSGAGAKITAQGSTGRNIWMFDHASATAGDRRKAFNWASLNAGTTGACDPPLSERGCFTSPYIDTLAQFCTMDTICIGETQQASASGENLVEYLRGSRTHDSSATDELDRWYRERLWNGAANVLGDIVSSEAVYVGSYLFKYGNGYPTGATRSYPTVYVAANDGMLHAINATSSASGGGERWAYVPSMALKNMHRLADMDYATLHRYMVDGTPVVADVEDGGSWKTILVGGLAGGGPGYYALEIDSNGGSTNQTQPKVLWEFKYGDLVETGANAGQVSSCTTLTTPRYKSANGVTTSCDLGYSFGNPVIGKVGGQWVVMVTSGYNNHLGGGDGRGYLYVLNAMTGAVVQRIGTGAGSTTDPSGLGRINGWVDDAMTDNTITAVYGGDLWGNMWAFDPAAGTSRLLIATGKPITAKPELGEVSTNSGARKKVVFFPTGRLLGSTDVDSPTSGNSFFGVWDSGSTAALDDATIIPVTGVSTGDTDRTGTVIASVFETTGVRGWRLPLDTHEQGNTDPTLVFGTLVFSTNKPTSADVCNESGFDSWVYNIDWLSGGVVEMPDNTNTALATHYEGAATRPSVIVIDGQVKSITRLSDATNQVADVRIKSQTGSARRVSWRELMH